MISAKVARRMVASFLDKKYELFFATADAVISSKAMQGESFVAIPLTIDGLYDHSNRDDLWNLVTMMQNMGYTIVGQNAFAATIKQVDVAPKLEVRWL